MAQIAPPATFLIIGFARNGTRWLRSDLDRHPEICAPPIDTRFFLTDERLESRGHRWYRDQFADWKGETILGEACPSYLSMWNDPAGIAARIRRHLPDVKLIAIAGDPVARIRSALAHRVRWGLVPADVDPEAFYRMTYDRAMLMEEFGPSLQFNSLTPYLKHFGDQVQVIFRDDIETDPASVYRSVLEHLGADPTFVPAGIAERRFTDREVVTVPPPEPESHRLLFDWFRPDVEKVEELTGRDLSGWDPGVGDPDFLPAEAFVQLFLAAAGGQP